MKERKSNHKHILALILTVALIAGLAIGAAAEDAATEWTLDSSTEIYLVKSADTEKNYAALEQQVQLFSSELAEKYTVTALPISYGDGSNAGANDIVLILDTTTGRYR